MKIAEFYKIVTERCSIPMDIIKLGHNLELVTDSIANVDRFFVRTFIANTNQGTYKSIVYQKPDSLGTTLLTSFISIHSDKNAIMDELCNLLNDQLPIYKLLVL